MRARDFNCGWKVKHLDDDGAWREVTLPDDAMLREPRTADALGGLNVSWFEGHDYLYSKTFSVSAEELARHNVLELEGVYRRAEVIINNRAAGQRPYGYTNFYIGALNKIKSELEIPENKKTNTDKVNALLDYYNNIVGNKRYGSLLREKED